MLNWLAAHVTLPYIMVFVVGLLAGYGINWYVSYRRLKKTGEPMGKRDGFVTIVGIIIVIAMGWIMVSTQQARNCAITLNVAVAKEQQAATIERNAFQDAITKSLALPPNILALPQNDPERVAATKPITDEYLGAAAKAAELRKGNQASNDAARAACGK